MVLVVVCSPDTLIQGYGETTKGNGKEPGARSLLQIGSVPKVFTTELLTGTAAEEKLRLTDPLQRYAASDLLAGALAAAGGNDYRGSLQDRITGPRSMADTGVEPTSSNAIG
jgi:D-alanyl-D-alanine-carboxypeptidase/D-alanyl-D-alanine-endopeptidase